jgi:CTP:molybdopterin cytidylyltransferase MocA
MPPEIAAIVLAAGLSSRMGRFKPLLPLGGATVLERVVGLYREAGVREVKVVLGHRAEELLPLLRGWGMSPVVNPDYREGMFGSVAAGVASLSPGVEAFFMHPVDIPLVRPETVRALGQALARDRASVIYPTFRGRRGHPPLISAGLAGALRSWRGPEGLRGFLRGYEGQALELAVADEFILRDMDLPADYAALAERLGRAPGEA